MILFFLSNTLFLASFVWLLVSDVGLLLWAAWIAAWFAADYVVIWMTGYQPPNWAWGAVLGLLAALWALLESGMVGV